MLLRFFWGLSSRLKTGMPVEWPQFWPKDLLVWIERVIKTRVKMRYVAGVLLTLATANE